MKKCRFLTERSAGIAEAKGARTGKLIARALGDITRLKKRKELKR